MILFPCAKHPVHEGPQQDDLNLSKNKNTMNKIVIVYLNTASVRCLLTPGSSLKMFSFKQWYRKKFPVLTSTPSLSIMPGFQLLILISSRFSCFNPSETGATQTGQPDIYSRVFLENEQASDDGLVFLSSLNGFYGSLITLNSLKKVSRQRHFIDTETSFVSMYRVLLKWISMRSCSSRVFPILY